jgi:hypothetical protein
MREELKKRNVTRAGWLGSEGDTGSNGSPSSRVVSLLVLFIKTRRRGQSLRRSFLRLGRFEEGLCPMGGALDIAVEVTLRESPMEPVDPAIGDAALFREGPHLEGRDAEILCRAL